MSVIPVSSKTIRECRYVDSAKDICVTLVVEQCTIERLPIEASCMCKYIRTFENRDQWFYLLCVKMMYGSHSI